MNLDQFDNLFKKEPSFRLKQAKKALFQNLIESWQEASVFPLNLRKELEDKCPINISAKDFISKDKDTIKSLITLKDGLKIETVLMRHKDGRNTVCVSSQAGCPLGCSFCATGKMGFKRNLDSWEIVEQIIHFSRLLKKKGGKVTSIVFMGMGEPFLNYDNVISAVKILNDKDGFNLGARHFSISTVGIIEGIKNLAKESMQINLAVSLHAPEDGLRSRIMQVNRKYPIKSVLNTVEEYIKETKRRVMIEYLMIRDVNDSDEMAEKLASLTKKTLSANNNLFFINLITYNPTGIFQPSGTERIKKFREILEKNGISVTQRFRFGEDIDAACGQLAGKQI
ncbi:MAG: 23S rRNA (adenine(2503)-C(2))-methyltransferase RlmN [Candidatus Pacebacteria bacterium]|nr:23S rRNA (adenine(2503)-C(2))-methyltransferase RlmN [Candidatus Paceibacterota bacterium]